MDNETIIKRLGRLLGYLERLDNEIINENAQDSEYAIFIRHIISKVLTLLRLYNKVMELKVKDNEQR